MLYRASLSTTLGISSRKANTFSWYTRLSWNSLLCYVISHSIRLHNLTIRHGSKSTCRVYYPYFVECAHNYLVCISFIFKCSIHCCMIHVFRGVPWCPITVASWRAGYLTAVMSCILTNEPSVRTGKMILTPCFTFLFRYDPHSDTWLVHLPKNKMPLGINRLISSSLIP